METVLGLDCGTQSTKAIIYSPEEQRTVATSSAAHDLHNPEEGVFEQSVETWLNALRSCLDAIDPKIRNTVSAVAVSGQQHGFVALDKEGDPLIPAKLWCDSSTLPQANRINEAFGGNETLVKRMGNQIIPAFTASKILWFKETYPEKFQKLAHVLLPHDMINFFLTNRATMEYGDASGTGLLNIYERRWDDEMIDFIDPSGHLKTCLPPLIEHNQIAGRLTKEASKILGLREGIPVAPGGGDNMMAAIGTGTLTDGTFTLSLGTSGVLFAHSSKPVTSSEEGLASFCSSTGGGSR